MNANKNDTIRVWFYTNAGKLVMGNVRVRDMEEARELARRWNHEDPHADETIRTIDIVQNAEKACEATKVSAIY